MVQEIGFFRDSHRLYLASVREGKKRAVGKPEPNFSSVPRGQYLSGYP